MTYNVLNPVSQFSCGCLSVPPNSTIDLGNQLGYVLYLIPTASLSDLALLDFHIPEFLEPLMLHDERLLRSLLTVPKFIAFAELPSPYTYWPEGLHILLQSGKLVYRDHLRSACTMNLMESATLLVSARQFYIDASILRSALQTGNVKIMKLIVDALVEQKTELQTLAGRHLPRGQLASLHIKPKTLLDYQAHRAYQLLKANGIELDEWGDRYCDDPWLVYASIRGSCEMAELLWHGGFQYVDDTDFRGRTSLMFCQDLNFADWLISHGADINRRVSGTPALHLVASNVFNLLVVGFDRDERSLRTLHLILQDTIRDECNCPCSSSGCFAVTRLLNYNLPWRT